MANSLATELRNLQLKKTSHKKDKSACYEVGSPATGHSRIEQLVPSDHEANKSIEDSKINWVFVEEVPGYMKCTIVCCDIFEAPQMLVCCGRNICKKCIDRYLQRIAALTDQKPSCPHCRKEDFQLINNTALELAICQLKVQCIYRDNSCGWIGALKDGKLHLKECDFFPINCPNRCGCEMFQRNKLSDHLSKCTLQLMSCSFHDVGCSEVLLRDTVETHAVDSIHQHLLFMARQNALAASECRSILDVNHLNCDATLSESTDIIHSQKNFLQRLQSTIVSLEGRLHEIQQKIKPIRYELAKWPISIFKKREEQAMSIVAILRTTMSDIRSLPWPKATGISCPPVTFTVDKIKKRMITNDEWLSPPFYTHVRGYKMCLSVHPKGYGIAQGKSVSVAVHFLMGEFDDYLQWPFPGGVLTITAISSNMLVYGKSVNLKVIGDDTLQIRSKQTDSVISDAFRRYMFIDHRRELHHFLHNDSFKIKLDHIQCLSH